MSGVLLDTCALIWFLDGEPMRPGAVQAIQAAAGENQAYVSIVSAWEVGLLSRPRANRPPAVVFDPDPKAWFARALAKPGVRLLPLDPVAAIDSAHLPGDLHNDPADRLIVASARHMGVPIVTRDVKLIDYGHAGFVNVITC